jgi:acetylornithine deacetylase/succinyl-diaminopimelate desuccinylase-like protein
LYRRSIDASASRRSPSLPDDAGSELATLLAIPSVSADPAQAGAVREAADWVLDAVLRAGGSGGLVEQQGSVLVDATVSASRGGAPTVLCYGHFDVQPPGEPAAWDAEPFGATFADGWILGRGIADDKGQLWLLLRAAADLAGKRELPVNVRFVCDGEEEVGGTAIVDHLAENAGDAAACLIFDTPMLDDHTHVFTTATRGTISMHVECRTGAQDLHSGVYGGAALNAVHVLLGAIWNLFESYGSVVPELRVGAIPASAAEREQWQRLPPGDLLLGERNAAPAAAGAGRDFYRRTLELPSLDVNGVHAGSPFQPKTIVVAEAHANLSMRLADGQRATELAPVLERLLYRRLPEAATLRCEVLASCDPGRVDPQAPALRLAADAFEAALGKRPLFLRSGGSLPLMPLLQELTIPAVVTGFAVPASNMHAPNERMRISDLEDGLNAACATLRSFGDLPRRSSASVRS